MWNTVRLVELVKDALAGNLFCMNGKYISAFSKRKSRMFQKLYRHEDKIKGLK